MIGGVAGAIIRKTTPVITCHLTYEIDLAKLAEFEEYAKRWVRIIERHGGTHHGYFLPSDEAPAVDFSFPEIAGEGAGNMAFALFSFPGEAEYLQFRKDAALDDECLAATEYQKRTRCFLSYRRSFVQKLEV